MLYMVKNLSNQQYVIVVEKEILEEAEQAYTPKKPRLPLEGPQPDN